MADVYKKRKQGDKLTSKEKQIVINVYKHLNRHLSVSDAVKETSAATGCSERTIYSLRREASKGELKTPSKLKPRKNVNKNSRVITYSDFVKSSIRGKVHNFFFNHTPPTLNSVLSSVNEDNDLPMFTRSTLNRLLKDIGFVYEGQGKNALLVEKDDIIRSRHRYLREIRKSRNENRNIIFTDESWVNVCPSINSEWKDKTVNTPQQAFLSFLSMGLKPPTSRDPRFALVHAGSDDGFIAGAEYIFLCKKNTADVHNEMDGECYEQWFENKLLRNAPNGSVIVIDNAPYHSRKCEDIPNSKWKKDEVRSWLRDKNIDFDKNDLKRELLAAVNVNKHKYDFYKIDKIAIDKGFRVLRLPPYHCELNPIEMVWAQVKHYVATSNFKHKDMEATIHAGFSTVTKENWKSYINHVRKVEETLWKADELQDDLDALIARLSPVSSSASHSSQSPSSSATEPEAEPEPSSPSTSRDLVVDCIATMAE